MVDTKKNGLNIKGTPPIGPLDMFETKAKDGILYLGQLKTNPVGGA